MKNILKLFFASLFIFNFSCQESDNVIDQVLDYETGAILRTIQIDNGVLNTSDLESTFVVTVEAQDEQDGEMLQEVRVYTKFKDLTQENGETVGDEGLASVIDASVFTTDTPHGLPRGQISMSMGDALAATGLEVNDETMIPGDAFVVMLEVVLKDGRTYGVESAAGIITGGFFSSPFQYNALLSCSPEPGDYRIVMQDGYGDGWQSTGIEVCIDGVCEIATVGGDHDVVEDQYAEKIISVPEGSQQLTWNWPGDSYPNEVHVQIYAPDGSILFVGTGQDPDDMYCWAGLQLGCVNEVPPLETTIMEPGLLPVTLCAQ